MSTARRGTTVLVMALLLGLVAPARAEAAGSQVEPSAARPRIRSTELVGPNGELLIAGYLNEQGQVYAEVHEYNGNPDPQGTMVFWDRGRATFVEPEGVQSAYAADLSDTGVLAGVADDQAFSWQAGSWRLLPGDPGVPFATNDVGQVAGYLNLSTGSQQGVVWQGDTITPAPVTGTNSVVLDVNDRGQALVSYVTETAPGFHRWVCLVWDVGSGDTTDIGSIGGPFTQCEDINDQGQVVGYSSNADGETHAFLWDDGEMTDLGALGEVARESQAWDVNEEGDAVGWSRFYGPNGYETHAVLWRDGRTIDLGSLGGRVSQALAINDRGQVVGSSSLAGAGGQDRPFLWEHGRMTDLLPFVDPELSPIGGGAHDINNRGQILGRIGAPSGSETPLTHAILWSTRNT